MTKISSLGGTNLIGSVRLAQPLGIESTTLPLKYTVLDLPLVNGRLGNKYSLRLLEKVKFKISNWKNRLLSHARRLELVKYVLCSFVTYWARAFLLSESILAKVNAVCKRFIR